MHEHGPELLREVLARLFTARGWGRQQATRRLVEAWRRAVGPEHASGTQVRGLKHGVLEIVVENAVVLQELAHYHKRRLLTALAEQLPGARITDIRFRLGRIANG